MLKKAKQPRPPLRLVSAGIPLRRRQRLPLTTLSLFLLLRHRPLLPHRHLPLLQLAVLLRLTPRTCHLAQLRRLWFCSHSRTRSARTRSMTPIRLKSSPMVFLPAVTSCSWICPQKSAYQLLMVLLMLTWLPCVSASRLQLRATPHSALSFPRLWPHVCASSPVQQV